MDKKILMQYSDLQQEIKELQAKIKKNEDEIRKIEECGAVVDKVSGGDGGRQHYQIEGFPYPEYSRKKTLLYARRATLSALEFELLQTLWEVEKFISTVNDSRMRRIINLRIIDGMSWQEVANKIGGNTEGSVKMAFQRFMENN